MKLTLETERLLLRPFEPDDAEDIFTGWASDPEVTKYLTWNTHKSIDDTKFVLDMWIKEYEMPERINCAIVLKSENKLIGGIDVNGYENGIPVIGYDLSRKYWNNGYMTEACKCMLRYLFSRGYEKIRIYAMVENIGSNRVIQKCGGILDSTGEDFLPLKNKTITKNLYYIINPDLIQSP